MIEFWKNPSMDLIAFLLELAKGYICVFLFAFRYKKRSRWPTRIGISIPIGLVLCAVLSVWKMPFGYDSSALAMFVRIASNAFLQLYPLAVLLLCYDESIPENMFCWCMFMAVNSFTSRSYSLLLNVCGIDDKLSVSFFPDGAFVLWRDYGLLGFYHVLLFVGFALLFQRRAKIQSDTRTLLSIAGMSMVLMLSVSMLANYTRTYEDMNTNPGLTISVKLFNVISSLFAIFLCMSIQERNRLTQDLEITEWLLQQEKRQYEISKENVEAINMRCHDLKHRLTGFEEKLSRQELDSLREAIDLYDMNIKTGNQILDVVLYEKQLFCQRYGITLSCMANGALIDFITPSHVYSLFGNAIDNAIEAEKDLDNVEEKVIDLFLDRDGERAVIEISNYYNGERLLDDGIPTSTTKEDRNTHGYGVKSMRFVVEQYGGTMSAQIEDQIFLLRIEIPLKA